MAEPGEGMGEKKPLSTRLLIAIPLDLVLGGIGFVIYRPASALAGFLTDTCSSGSNAYLMWEIWLGYIWPVILFISALIPSILIVMNRPLKWILISLFAGGTLSVVWYFLWVPVLFLTGC